MPISDQERLLYVLAEEMESSIASCFQKVSDSDEWVDSNEEAHALMTRMRGIFISSLVGEIEEKIGRPFSSVFDQLSDQPTLRNSEYWFVDMPAASTPRGRAKVMWAIRIAYTHGNGHCDQIDDENVRSWVEPRFANRHFRGVEVRQQVVNVFGDVTFPALKTALQISSMFSSS